MFHLEVELGKCERYADYTLTLSSREAVSENIFRLSMPHTSDSEVESEKGEMYVDLALTLSCFRTPPTPPKIL